MIYIKGDDRITYKKKNTKNQYIYHLQKQIMRPNLSIKPIFWQ